MAKINKFKNTIPKVYQVGTNPNITAMVRAFANSDDTISEQIENAKEQMFVRTAVGRYLNLLANSMGVSKPIETGLTDTQFQELIPNLTFKPKQVRKIFYDTAEVFWGALYTHANVTSINAETWDLDHGDEIKVSIDGGTTQTIVILESDIETEGAATKEELLSILSRIKNATASLVEDKIAGDFYINVRSNTLGPRGSVQFLSSTGIGVTKLNFTTEKIKLESQDQRFSIYEVNPNEITIEIPAIVPTFFPTLKGTHHFHADATIEEPEPTANGIWQGSFLFNPSGSDGNFTITNQFCRTEETLSKGNVYTKVTVTDTELFRDTSGYLIFGFGTEREEQPVKFRGIPNSKTVLLDPSYIFQKDHPSNEAINVISALTPTIPRTTGEDLAIYLPSPSRARAKIEDILETLTAAGILIRFIVLAPKYKYLQNNPYLTSDDPRKV